MTLDQLPPCLFSNTLVFASSPYLLLILKYQLHGRLERTLMESENKEERGKTGKGCRKRELIHQPNSQGEQNCQVGMCGEKEDRRVVRREDDQQQHHLNYIYLLLLAKLPIWRQRRGHWDVYEFNEYGLSGFYTADSPVQM